MKMFISFIIGYITASILCLAAIVIEPKHKKASIFMKGPIYWIVYSIKVIGQKVTDFYYDYKYRTIIKKDNGEFFCIKPSIMRGWHWASPSPEIKGDAKYVVPFFEELGENVHLWPKEVRRSTVYCPKIIYEKYRSATTEEVAEIKKYLKRMEEYLPF